MPFGLVPSMIAVYAARVDAVAPAAAFRIGRSLASRRSACKPYRAERRCTTVIPRRAPGGACAETDEVLDGVRRYRKKRDRATNARAGGHYYPRFVSYRSRFEVGPRHRKVTKFGQDRR